MSRDDNGGSIGRRRVLKGLSSVTAASAIGTTVVSGGPKNDFDRLEEEFKRDVRRARHIREQSEDHSRFVEYLRNKGYGIGSTTTLSRFPTEYANGPSTQRLDPKDDSELRASISIVDWHYRCSSEPSKTYVEYYFEWDVDSGFGEPYRDSFGMGWPAQSFEYNEDSHESSGNVSFYRRANGLNGVSFKYRDNNLSNPDYDDGYGGCYLRVGEDGYSSETTFAGEYAHTYNKTSVCGYSVSSSGDISYNVCANQRVEYGGYTQTDHSETDHNYNNC